MSDTPPQFATELKTLIVTDVITDPQFTKIIQSHTGDWTWMPNTWQAASDPQDSWTETGLRGQ